MNRQEPDNLLDQMRGQILHCGMLEAGDRWLVAVSGGADSMALLHGLITLQKEGMADLKYLHVAHLNHKLRAADSEADAEFVQTQGRQLGLKVSLGQADVAELARQSGESIESAARQARYEFLQKTAHAENCQKIALGHTADDNAETIMHRIVRGTGIRGLAGMPAMREAPAQPGKHPLQLVRPLLSVRRTEIERFVEEKGIPYREDRSNFSPAYTRNRIRHELLPILKEQFNPRVYEALLRLGQTAEWMSEILSVDAAAALNELTVDSSDGSLSVDTAGFAGKPRIEQAQIIHEALEKLGIGLRHIGFEHIRAILALLAEGPVGQGTVQLPNRVTVTREGNKLTFRKASALATPCSTTEQEEFALKIPGITQLGQSYIWFEPAENRTAPLRTIEVQEVQSGWEDFQTFRKIKDSREEMIDPARLEGLLVVRNRRAGETFQPLGTQGTKKLGDFLTDAKVPVEQRDRLAILCDARGIVWVIGMRIAERVKMTSTTRKALKLTLS